MTALDGLWHLLNLFAPAFGVGVLTALLAKLVWWRELRGASVLRMCLWAVSAASLATVAALVWTGRDGKMAGYVAMLVACSIALWWAGWRSPRS